MHSARRILTWSLCAAPVALLLHYAAGAQTSATRYQCDDGGFSLVPPPAWKRTAEVPRGYAAFLAPQQDGFVSNLVAYREPAGHKTLDDVVKSTRESFPNKRSMRLVSVSRLRLGGAPAAVFGSTVTSPDHPTSFVRQIVAVRGSYRYLVTLTTPPSQGAKFDSVFARIAKSFRFEDKKSL